MMLLQPPEDPTQKLPASLMRRYEVFIRPRSSVKPLKMREIKAASIGHLVTMRVRTALCDATTSPAPLWLAVHELVACNRGPNLLHCCVWLLSSRSGAE